MKLRSAISGSIYGLSAVLGILAFLYPFFLHSQTAAAVGLAHSQDAPLVTAMLVGLSLLALLVEMEGEALSAKTVALLGVLVALTSALRFLEVAFPMPGGFSPIFAFIILAGHVFGGRFGFLMGVFTLLASALITGGVGPWLPYQMFTAGWVGLTAGWLPRKTQHTTRSFLLLSTFAFAWGFLYGAVMNLYFWPFAVGPAGQSWQPGIGLKETLARYAAFYIVTSLGWDLMRALGNLALILVLGAPVVRVFTRFRHRFHFELEASNG